VSRDLGPELPPEAVEALSGGRLVLVATVDEDGWPYTMVMNWAAALDSKTVRLSLDNRTRTLANVRRNGRVMLEAMADGLIVGVRGRARVIQENMAHAPIPSAMVEVAVERVKSDLIEGVQFTAPSFRWGTLEQLMTPLDPLGIAELKSFMPQPGPEA
jgi:hypothetical protein